MKNSGCNDLFQIQQNCHIYLREEIAKKPFLYVYQHFYFRVGYIFGHALTYHWAHTLSIHMNDKDLINKTYAFQAANDDTTAYATHTSIIQCRYIRLYR